MKNMIKTEIRKAFVSKYFMLGLLLLMTFAILSAWYMIEVRIGYNPDSIYHYMENGQFTRNPDLPLFGFYNSWIGGENLSLANTLFFVLLPVGAALPYGWSFHTERKSGYIKNVVSRIDKRSYFFAKTIAVFTSGMLAVFIPLVSNILLTSAFIPIVSPFAGYTFYNYVYFGNMWSDLFFTNPFLHMILYVLLDTLYGGIFALLSFAVTFYVKNIFSGIFVPFLSMLGLSYVEGIIHRGFSDIIPIEFIPTKFLHSRSLNAQTMGWSVLAVTLFLLVFALLTIFIRGSKDEVF